MRCYAIFGSLVLLNLVSCVTSTELAQKDNYVDPTNVATVEVPNPALQTKSTEAIEREYDTLKGRLEETEFKARQLEEENKKLAEELAKAKAPPAVVTPTTAVSNDHPANALLNDSAEKGNKKTGAPLLWELATKDIKEGHYKESLSPLGELVKTYPKDPSAFFAMLAMPMIHYRIENYKEAALEFNQLIDKYPKRSETSIAWFGQGAAFFKLGQKEDSRLFYEETAKRFPKSDAAAAAKKYMATRKGGAPKDLFLTFPHWSAKSPH